MRHVKLARVFLDTRPSHPDMIAGPFTKGERWGNCCTSHAPRMARRRLTNVALADADRIVDRDAVQRFATLPDGVRYPEGITADPDSGQVYVGTFDFGPNANKLLRYGRHGQLLAVKDFGAAPLLGLEFRHDKVYIANFGASKIQRIKADFNSNTNVEDVATLPSIGAPRTGWKTTRMAARTGIVFGSNKFPAPNAMVFDRHGNLTSRIRSRVRSHKIEHAAHCTAPRKIVTGDPGSAARDGGSPVRRERLALNRDERALHREHGRRPGP